MFVAGFNKIASQLPKWIHGAHQAIPNQSLPGISKKNLVSMMKRRGLGK